MIVGGLDNGEYGFPSGITDDPVMNMVLARRDGHEHAEERRLFYVAVTRARRKAYLIADSTHPSPFVKEITQDPGYGTDTRGAGLAAAVSCQACRSGILLVRDGANGLFVGCSNYPVCRHTERTCPRCRQGIMAPVPRTRYVRCKSCDFEAELCPRCETGRLVVREGKFGKFLGCTNYGPEPESCTYTRDLKMQDQ